VIDFQKGVLPLVVKGCGYVIDFSDIIRGCFVGKDTHSQADNHRDDFPQAYHGDRANEEG